MTQLISLRVKYYFETSFSCVLPIKDIDPSSPSYMLGRFVEVFDLLKITNRSLKGYCSKRHFFSNIELYLILYAIFVISDIFSIKFKFIANVAEFN